MTKKTPIINDFRSGELTPGLDARSDIKDYYRGCRVLVNAMPITEGGAERVPGTRFVRIAKVLEEGWRLAVFKIGTGTGVVTSSPAGVNCGAVCAQFYPEWTTVVLTAVPDSGQEFVGWSGDGTGTVTRTVVMSGDKVVTAEFSSQPCLANLVAWYRLTEGAGATVHNYADPTIDPTQKWPDLTIVNPTGFWGTKPGFGSSSPAARAYAEYSDVNSILTSTMYDTFGLFLFRVGFDQSYPISFGAADSIVATVTPKTYHEFYGTDSEMHLDGNAFTRMGSAISANDWKFIFVTNEGGTNNMKGYQVNSNGTLTTFANLGGGSGTATYKRIRLLMDYTPGGNENAYIYGSLGDVMVWRGSCMTSTSKFASTYDALRSRYGMEARSGW